MKTHASRLPTSYTILLLKNDYGIMTIVVLECV
jgi:hypothetical protein